MWSTGVDENPDWGFARNGQLLLKTGRAEYSSSAYTASIALDGRRFYGANRDYHWQGLTVIHPGGELYKVLDGLFCSPGFDLDPRDVLFDARGLVYRYGNDFDLRISLRNCETGVRLVSEASKACWYALLLDFTPGSRWDQGRYEVGMDGHSLCIDREGIPLKLIVRGFDEAGELKSDIAWKYKLGDGFREDRGRLEFRETFRHLHIPATLHSPDGRLEIDIPVGRKTHREDAKTSALPDVGSGPVARAFKLRLETLLTYGLPVDDMWFPEAGSFWFRKPWLRDALEGIFWNLRTYLLFHGWKTRLSRLISHLLAVCRKFEGLPIILVKDAEDYTSDAPPRLIWISSDLSRLTSNQDLLERALDLAEYAAERLLGGKEFSKSALIDGVICSRANSSWLDSLISVDGRLWPTRLPEEWQGEGIDGFGSEFGLVEVNALYIAALDYLEKCCGELGASYPEELVELSSTLIRGFKEHFKVGSSLPALTVAPQLGLMDKTRGSPSVVALSTLEGSVFGRGEINQLWAEVRDHLLVNRSLQRLGNGRHPFGVLVKEGDDPYLGDVEYHSSVIWPRDTPYLITLMEKVGEDTAGILVNNLDHMVSEGVIGYCGEMFSLPTGVNPNPTPESSNPVPVKNPAQYWSHWCDPYLGQMEKLGIGPVHSAGE